MSDLAKPIDNAAPKRPASDGETDTSHTQNPTVPPTVSGNPSSDTRGGAGTSTAEGPARPKTDVPPDDNGTPHVKRRASGKAEVPPPGSRVDDEHEGHGDKRMKRQE